MKKSLLSLLALLVLLTTAALYTHYVAETFGRWLVNTLGYQNFVAYFLAHARPDFEPDGLAELVQTEHVRYSAAFKAAGLVPFMVAAGCFTGAVFEALFPASRRRARRNHV